jgi:outer membrane protein assembly factor BamB
MGSPFRGNARAAVGNVGGSRVGAEVSFATQASTLRSRALRLGAWITLLLLVACSADTGSSGKEDGRSPRAGKVRQALHEEPGDCTLSVFQGRAYYYCTNSETWDVARDNCRSRPGLELVRVDDEAENAFVRSIASGEAWIGANDRSAEGVWRWSAGSSDDGPAFWNGGPSGTAVGGLYSNWDGGQPNDFAGQDCAEIESDGQWDDEDCGGTSAYVCEGDACPSDPSKIVPGACGCGVADVDTDGDGRLDCFDLCPADPSKVAPGDCGCSNDPAPAGTSCDDGLCAANNQCDGAGACGAPAACAPAATCSFDRFAASPSRGYYFCPGTSTWDAARAACRALSGGDLVRVDSQAENDFVFARLTAAAWLGGNDRVNEGSWQWAQGGSLKGDRFWSGGASGESEDGRFANWKSGQPGSSAEDCARMDVGDAGRWNDATCGSLAAFVCEIAPEGERGLEAAGAWPMFGHSAPHRGRSPVTAAQTADLNWATNLGTGLPVGSPAVSAAETIYVPSGRKLFAVDVGGNIQWSFEAADSISGTAAVAADRTIYVAAIDGHVHALEPSGVEHWRFDAHDSIGGSPTVAPDGTVLVATDDDLIALSPDGSERWSFNTGNARLLSPAVGPDKTLLIGSETSEEMIALSPGGNLLWRHDADDKDIQTGATVGLDGVSYFGAGQSLFAVKSDGARQWRYNTSGAVFSGLALSPDGTTVYAGSDDGSLHAVLTATGSRKWARVLGGTVRSTPALGDDGLIYIGAASGTLHALRPSDGTTLWSLPTAGPIGSAVAIGKNGTVYTGSADGKLYSVGGGPEPFVTCVTRWTDTNYSALFGYRNRLGVPATIPVGPQNHTVPPAPPGVIPDTFRPGEIDAGFWVQFDGTSVTWTLRGRSATATAATPRCTGLVYPIVPTTQDDLRFPERPGTLRPDVLAAVPSDHQDADHYALGAPLSAMSSGGASVSQVGTVQQALTIPQGNFTVHITELFMGGDIGLGGCDVPDYRASLSIDGQSCGESHVAGSDVCNKCAGVPEFLESDATCCAACGVNISVGISKSCTKPVPITAPTVTVGIGLIEFDDASGSETLAGGGVVIDNSTGQIVSTIGGHVDSRGVFIDANSGWGFRLQVVPVGPPPLSFSPLVCASYNAHFVDEGTEDVLGTPVQGQSSKRYPAAFAQAELNMEGPLTGPVSWFGFLDQDGCVPAGSVPNNAFFAFSSATAGDPTTGGVSMTLEWNTQHYNGSANWVVYDVTAGRSQDDPGTGQNFKLDSKVRQIATLTSSSQNNDIPFNQWTTAGNWSLPPQRIDVRNTTENDVTRASAVVTQILRTPDTAIAPGLYEVHSNDGCPDADLKTDSCVSRICDSTSSSPSTPQEACETDQLNRGEGREVLFVGPATGGLPTQSHWKFIVAHEAGHYVQGAAMGGFGTSYNFCPTHGPYTELPFNWLCADFVATPDPPGTPPLCGCSHVDSANGLHCLQSIERQGAAQLEGFAQFFASKTWNHPDESACTFNYYKEFLSDTCQVPGTCDPFAADPALVVNKPPYVTSCKQPVRWRNTHCAGPILNPTPDPAQQIGMFSTEYDWLGCLWNINTSTANKLSMNQIFDVYRRACRDLATGTPQACQQNLVLTWSDVRGFETGALLLFGNDPQNPQYQHVVATGNAFGISLVP